MKKQERSFSFLEQFLPPGSLEQVAPFFKTHVIHLTLTNERRSVLGDYRNPTSDTPYHRISINANLNKYSFLITLLHELAHLFTHVHFGHRASPHGNEWKTQFRHILIPFMGKRFFPADVERALYAYLHNPAASTCTDAELFRSLYRYDEHKPGYKLVDDIAINQFFEIEDGEVFQKVEKLRTRTKCRSVATGKMYLFQGIMEVKAVRRRPEYA
ncbi:SprT-like domain-containing protein [Nemorincola caseinilytica]|uniref:SprT-like domain-containing protein n=1 Tax=Nemorincola caseinilytica TaxID=2054315 RepID=A0ABP8N163_9BACT